MLARITTLTATLALVFAATVHSADEPKLEDVKCPVSGRAAKADFAVDYKDAKVYFCCPNCPKGFEANTEKFAAKANHQLAKTDQAKETKCPFTGRKLNPNAVVEVDGEKVAFCCNNCKGKAAKAEGDEQIVLIFSNENFERGYEMKKDKEEEK